jgi:outer membrane receptor protein involved in Fe transport
MDLSPALTLSLGASGDFFEGLVLDQRQFSPKLGLQWRPWPGLTLRGAAIRTLFRPNLANQQTLEPVSVAGFNQFFNDPSETESWHYGLAADLALGERLFMGLSLSQRDLDVPFFLPPASPDQPGPTVEIADWQEHLGYAYSYWAPTQGLALSAEYFFERFERDERFVNTGRIQTLWSRRLRLGARFFDPRGFRAFLGASYVNQHARIFQGEGLDDSFWVLDATLGYRLPRRYGLVELEVKNLLDENFNYEETDPANPLFYPERLFLARITLNL